MRSTVVRSPWQGMRVHCSVHQQVEKPSDIGKADKLVFPGVGSFGQAMDVLTKRDLIKPLKEYLHVCVCVDAFVCAGVWVQQSQMQARTTSGRQAGQHCHTQ